MIDWTVIAGIFSHRFGNCFALFKEDEKFWVVWVTEFRSSSDKPGLDDEIVIYGRRFMRMRPSYVTKTFSMGSIHSYVVSQIEDEPVCFDKTQLVGKGTCLYLPMQTDSRRTNESEYKTPHRGQSWQFDLLDHCVDYDVVRRREDVDQNEALLRTVPARKRKRVPRVSDSDSDD